MSRKPPRTLWVVMCRDVDGDVFIFDADAETKAQQQALAAQKNALDASLSAINNRPRRHYWVEAYDRRAK